MNIKGFICDRIFRKHTLETVERIADIEKAKCRRCGVVIAINHAEGVMDSWDDTWQYILDSYREFYAVSREGGVNVRQVKAPVQKRQ